MGIGSSKGLNRIAMLKATESPRFVMNQILRFILDEISDKDVFKLQDPQVCQNFLILTADSLKKYFDTIELYPTKDEQKRLYFRRVSELTKPQSKELAEQMQSSCMALGYFYVRILQIYIALALSLIDDPKLVPGRAEYKSFEARERRPMAPGARIGALMKGGAGEEALYPKMKYIGQGGGELIKFSDLVAAGIITESIGAGGRKYKFIKNNQLVINALTESSGFVTEETLFDDRTRRRQGYGDYNNYSDSRSHRTAIGIRFELTGQMHIPEISVNGNRQKFIPNIIVDINDNYIPIDYQIGRSLEEFFEKVLNELQTTRTSKTLEYLRAAQKQADAIGAPKRREQIPLTSSRAVPLMDFTQNVQALSMKPLAHCIARSFQLLNVDALGLSVPKSSVTHICETKFKDDIIVPGPEEPISRIPGVHALNFLFFVLDKTPKLTDQTKEEYALSLSALSAAFADKPKEYEISNLKDDPRAIETIRAKTTCKKRGDQMIETETIKKARSGAAALWDFQRQHAVRVEKIFTSLFTIDKTGQISFNDFIFQKGIAGVNAIAAEARKVLVEYYSRCEEIYQTTVAAMSKA